MEDLNTAERDFIEITRAFGFLFKEGYRVKDFSIGGKEPGIKFQNLIKNRIIDIFWSEGGFIDIIISRRKFFTFNEYGNSFSVRNFYKYFNCEYLTYSPPIGTYNKLKHNSEFIQQHLMPVIKGEVWINELIKIQKKLKNN